MHLKLLLRGREKEIWAIASASGCPVTDFLRTQPDTDQQKVMKLIRMVADQGTLHNREKFRFAEEGIFEFKSYQIRIMCFFLEGKRIICTHAFRKKQPKTPRTEIVRAKRLRAEYVKEAEHE